MSRYSAEPKRTSGASDKTAVVLVNLGTPEAPTPSAVRRYLAEFLADPRVVEIPRWLWRPVLHGIILNIRPKASAKKYASIWSRDGSPLKFHTERQAMMLRGYLGDRAPLPLRTGVLPKVEFAMRYGKPSIADTLARLKSEGCDRILVLPLYPQYAASTTAAVFDEVAAFLRRTRNVPEIRMVKHYHAHPAYIDALASGVRKFWQQSSRPDKLLMSFHGLPRRTIALGDPYHDECHETARLLAAALNLSDDRWQISFQSRFGRAQWLQPYTAATLSEFGHRGMHRVDVICPGFTSDCLETLEEIGIEGKKTFLSAGGKEFNLLPCLNEHDEWIHALADIVGEHLGGWLAPPHP
jgi:ferrochelatase